MALSLCQYPNFSDLQAFFEPTYHHHHTSSKPNSNIDFFISNNNNNNNTNNNSNNNNNFINYNIENNNQMEYNNNTIVLQPNSTIARNFENEVCQNRNTHNINNNNNSNVNNFNDYEHVIHFVDSPPNSKESWPGEYNKEQHRPTILDVHTIYSNNINRKRRMDWEAIDINSESTENKSSSSVISNSKGPPIENKNHEKKKSAGRGSWTDDIDFDLNGDFSNNSYLNNAEPFLFSPGLSALKQEIPSPNAVEQHNQQRGGDKTPPITINHQVHNQIVQNSPTQDTENKKQDNNNITQSRSPSNNARQNVDHQVQQQQQQQRIPNSPQNGLSNNFHSILQQDNNLEITNARHSPNQIDPLKPDNVNDDYKFQYILAAATSIATKSNEETLTYLNQGQSYEIKLKKIGDLSFYRDKLLKSVIKICFHERRLQYMEREQMQLWQASRPGERIIEVDVPLSYGIIHVTQSVNSNLLNTVEVLWDPMKEIGVYIKVNCISTEFTPKKHGGEKGVPFRIQIETYLENANATSLTNPNNNNNTNNNNNNNNSNTNNNNNNNSNNSNNNNSSNNITNNNNSNNNNSNNNISNSNNNNNNNNSNNNNTGNNNNQNTNNNNISTANTIGDNLSKPIHAAACQIKVFKLKGADRKHKQDREKIQRRPPSEQEKYQPSYECTILNDISLDALNQSSAGCYSPEYMKIWPNSPVHMPKYEGILPFPAGTGASSPIAINNVTSTNPTNNLKLMEQNIMVSPQHVDMDEFITTISKDSSPIQVSQWLTYHRLNAYLNTFAQFSGSDILRMSKEDLIQVCGLADGIRMFNTLHSKRITPRLTIYVSLDGSNYNAIYLISNTVKELTQKLFKLPGFFEMISNNSSSVESSNGYPGWGMISKYSGSGSNIYNDTSKLFIFTTGPSGIHVMITDEVLNNAIKDESLFTLEAQNGKILMKNIIKSDNTI